MWIYYDIIYPTLNTYTLYILYYLMIVNNIIYLAKVRLDNRLHYYNTHMYGYTYNLPLYLKLNKSCNPKISEMLI